MNTYPRLLIPLCTLAVAAACGPSTDDAAPYETSASAARAWNARAWNARAWNARAWNARAWNARAWNGNSLGSTGIDGAGWELQGANGRVLSAATISLAGSALRFNGEDLGAFGGSVIISPAGLSELRLRFSGATSLLDAAGAPRGIDAYEVTGEFDGVWEPMFVDAAGAPRLAIALAGEWQTDEAMMGTPQGGTWSNSGRITFGARGYVLAKCVELGYYPWNNNALHLACVRMLRADYCGDGHTWTADGTLLNVYDNSGVQARDNAKPIATDLTSLWSFEAEWTVDGAVCVEGFRILHPNTDMPTCVAGRVLSALSTVQCGQSKGKKFGAFNTALIMSEFALSASGVVTQGSSAASGTAQSVVDTVSSAAVSGFAAGAH